MATLYLGVTPPLVDVLAFQILEKAVVVAGDISRRWQLSAQLTFQQIR
jgi:hypothetical protein